MRTAALLLTLTLCAAAAAQDPARRPNVIVIVGDDLGYGELGSYGGKDIPTPNLDSIAANGARFTQGYVSCPVCSPTRAGLLTGRYQQRFGHEFNPGPVNQADEKFGLPLDQVTLADALKAAGHKTGMVGKWHLGYKEAYHPLKRGFDEFFGFLGGAHSYVQAGATVLRGTEPAGEKEYLTDAFTREAVAFIDRHAKEPFFLYLTYNAVHAPLQAPPKYLDRFKDVTNEKRRNFCAMLSALDDGVGAILKKLRDSGLEEHTLLAFVSDNGGPTPSTTSRNGPLNGFKGGVLEGGIRVPFLMQWKGRIPAGKVFEQPVISLDLFPTACAAAGAKLPEGRVLDGVNLLPHLEGTATQAPHDALYWRFGPQSAIRKGDWKLAKRTGEVRLFDLAADVGEKTDLYAQKPEVAKELEAALAKWDAELAEPLWGGRKKKP